MQDTLNAENRSNKRPDFLLGAEEIEDEDEQLSPFFKELIDMEDAPATKKAPAMLNSEQLPAKPKAKTRFSWSVVGVGVIVFLLGLFVGWLALDIPSNSVPAQFEEQPVSKVLPLEEAAPLVLAKPAPSIPLAGAYAIQVAACRSSACVDKTKQLVEMPQDRIKVQSDANNIKRIQIVGFSLEGAKSKLDELKQRNTGLDGMFIVKVSR